MKTQSWVHKTIVIGIIFATFAAFGMQVRAAAVRESRASVMRKVRPASPSHRGATPAAVPASVTADVIGLGGALA